MTNGKHIRRSLKKGGFVHGCPAVYVKPAPNTEHQVCRAKRSKEKNPTDPIMIVVRFSNRCELLTLEIHFLESV